MSCYLDNYSRIFGFCYLVGARAVQLKGDEVVGRWERPFKEIRGPKPGGVVKELVNLPNDSKSILEFTERFGPIEGRPEAGKEFRFHIGSWRLDQKRFQWAWRYSGSPSSWNLNVKRDDLLGFVKGRLVYTTSSLSNFLALSLMTTPKRRLRMCGRDGCPHPYFVAPHPPQKYCSKDCSDWAKRKSKREWARKKAGKRSVSRKRLSKGRRKLTP